MVTKYPLQRFVDKIDTPVEIPEKISDGLKKTVDDFMKRFEHMDETRTSQKPGPDKWSRKEILGHLLDSAANNHQRFVRAQYTTELSHLSYQQNEWVKIQQYHSRPWKELLVFWKSYNDHLAHIIRNMSRKSLDMPYTLGSGEQVTIGYIVVDYLGHMQHHIRQIEQMG